MLEAVSGFVTGTRSSGSGGATGFVETTTNHIWMVWVLGPILLSLFIPQVREPIGQAFTAFFGLWAALWHRLTGFITKDPND